MRYISSLLLLCGLLLVSCTSLESESGLYDVKLEHTYKALVDGRWGWGKGNPFPDKKVGFIYVAPIDVSKIAEKEPKRAPLLVAKMNEYMTKELTAALDDGNKKNGVEWRLTQNPKEADIRVDIALIRFRPQAPELRVAAKVGGFFVPVPGASTIVENFAEGDICIEATVRNNRNNELLMAVKDSNRKSARLYKGEAYTTIGNADANFKVWAVKLGRLFRASYPDKLGGSTIAEKIAERNMLDVAKLYLLD